ncbi:hypothetical protein EDD29_0500 [Actinocorallia herbida]|uniref:Uncharacterized protein n=1 Tax=Actinocorallia herbida TaxID=58109 RepID=A0A3N1CNZ3_9ACTN|nr:hypothetical protein [Actinocorallia herbida]ROO83012.1 hypothetical protein EDD29_0500 [Actinocorallia herbida]
MRIVTVGGDDVGFIAIGQEAVGIIAIGQLATGVIAFGQLATGVIAIGQVARGVIAIGQLAVGIVAVGMAAVGVLFAVGMVSLSAFGAPYVTSFGLFGKIDPRALFDPRRDRLFRGTLPQWRLVMASLGTLVLLGAWWMVVGSALFLPHLALPGF